MSIRTRLATPDDAGAIAEVHTTAWQVAYDGVVPASYLQGLDVADRTRLWDGILTGEIAVEGMRRPVAIVALSKGQVVGFANVGPFRGAPQDTTAGEVWAIYVHPKHWGTGAGAALMKDAIADFQRRHILRGYLWVLEDNPRARVFYERFGWVAEDVFEVIDIGGEQLREVRYSLDIASGQPNPGRLGT